MAGPSDTPTSIQIIESYGPGGFRIGGVRHQGAVLVTPERTDALDADTVADLTIALLAPLTAPGANIELVLLGCGPVLQMPALTIRDDLRDGLRARGIALEPMDSGAACRTFNLLIAENRRVAAVLLPV